MRDDSHHKIDAHVFQVLKSQWGRAKTQACLAQMRRRVQFPMLYSRAIYERLLPQLVAQLEERREEAMPPRAKGERVSTIREILNKMLLMLEHSRQFVCGELLQFKHRADEKLERYCVYQYPVTIRRRQRTFLTWMQHYYRTRDAHYYDMLCTCHDQFTGDLACLTPLVQHIHAARARHREQIDACFEEHRALGAHPQIQSIEMHAAEHCFCKA